ncbi:MAG: xanthine dehydrogenase family protein molybdopterin-binding subunit [Pyrinomonadaceae bacterium]
MKYIGKEMSRVDGFAKVTGRAKYAAEFKVPEMAYGFLATSSIARGTIKSIDTVAAGKAAGVIKVYTHQNFPAIFPAPAANAQANAAYRALMSDKIIFNLQPIALVVAETFEQARFAARLITAEYDTEKPTTDMLGSIDKAVVPNPERAVRPRGNPKEALASAPVKVEGVYTIPIEHHNPMEPHGATAFWEGGKLTLFDKTQGVFMVRQAMAAAFGIPQTDVNVISPFVGGAFGSSLRPNYYPALVAGAAKDVKRPVKLVYTRTQMYTGAGYRPQSWQKVSLGAEKNGKLISIIHEAANNSPFGQPYSENMTGLPRVLYASPNADSIQKIVTTDLPQPAPMRAPGAVTGMFALESAMDELAYALKMDPLELRVINFSNVNPDNNRPYSSKALIECYRLGAEKFGWKNRKHEPGSMKEGRTMVGWGVASGMWNAAQLQASAKVVLRADGTANVSSGTTDIGPGTYTAMTMIAAEYLGLAIEKVKFELGDTKFPPAPIQGGSFTTASVGTAIYGAAQNIKKKLMDLANKADSSPFKTAKPEDLELANGALQFTGDTSRSVNVSQLMRQNATPEIEDTFQANPGAERQNYATGAHGVQFAEVKIDPDLRTIKVTRMIEVSACGKIMNPTTSHSQEIGGIVWGIGMALHEGTEIDHRYGRMMNANLQHYHVPVNADIMSVETHFIEEDDKIVNPLGVKGMGELGMVGVPAAIANAVFHATGKRVRDLPITIDKLL